MNYGTASLIINNTSSPTGNGKRVALVQFDLSGVTGVITQLRLDLTGTGMSTDRALNVYGLVNETANGQPWGETTVTWLTAPGVNHAWTNTGAGNLADYLAYSDLYGGGAILGSVTPTANTGTITPFNAASGPVLNFLAADTDKVVTFLIAEADLPSDPGNTLASREAVSGKPLLTVTTAPPPPPPSPRVVTFQPVADTYVTSKGAFINTNYGTDPTLSVNNSNGLRAVLVRFDLSSIDGTISNLRLDLTGTGMTTGKALNVYGLVNELVNGQPWGETTVTWMNAPGVNHTSLQSGVLADYLVTSDLYGGGTALANFTPTSTSGPGLAFNVGSGPVLNFVNADADKIVTFLIVETDPSTPEGNLFASREVPGQSPLLTVTCVPTGTAPPLIRVLLIGGQSNAVGYASSVGLPAALLVPQTDVLLYSHVEDQVANLDGTLGVLRTLHPGSSSSPFPSSHLGEFGPDVTLGQQLSPLLNQVPVAGTKLAIIKYAVGGTSLSNDWKAGGTGGTTGDGTFYQTFQQVVTHGLAKLAATYPTSTIQIGGMVWVQGEQDTNNQANADAYGTRLTAFIGDIRATYGSTLPFFFSRLSAQQTFYPTNRNAAFLAIRQGQQNVATNVSGAYLLNIDGPAFSVGGDGIHFDTAGQQALGTAFAARIAGVLNPQTFTKNTNTTQTLTGIQNYSTMTTNAGVLNVNGTIGSGTSAVVVANAGTKLNFGVSQTLSSLSIGAGATVTLTTSGPGSFSSAEAGEKTVGTVAATVATAPLTKPEPLQTSIAPGAVGMTITWNAVAGQSYSIQTSPDLVTWSVPFSVGKTGQWTDTDLAGVTARFYRVLEN